MTVVSVDNGALAAPSEQCGRAAEGHGAPGADAGHGDAVADTRQKCSPAEAPSFSGGALARAFMLDSNSEWVTVATGIPRASRGEDGLTLSLVDEGGGVEAEGHAGGSSGALRGCTSNAAIFSTVFEASQEVNRQQATVITWTSLDGSDVALSFENEGGCDAFWHVLCAFLNRSTEYSPINDDDDDDSEDDDDGGEESYAEASEGAIVRQYYGMCDDEAYFDDEYGGGRALQTAPGGSGEGIFQAASLEGISGQETVTRPPAVAPISLPDVIDLATLPAIEACLRESLHHTMEVRRNLAMSIIARECIDKLLEIFRLVEDLSLCPEAHEEGVPSDGAVEKAGGAAEEAGELALLYSIFKSLVLLNNLAIFRLLVSTAHIDSVLGVFEYGPVGDDGAAERHGAGQGRAGRRRPQEGSFRAFLRSSSTPDGGVGGERFKVLVEIENGALVDLIHQTFRAQYMKDVVLSAFIDEDAFATLSLMVRCNYGEIVEAIEGEENVFGRLSRLIADDGDQRATMEILKFVREFLQAAKACAHGGRQCKVYTRALLGDILGLVQRALEGSTGAASSGDGRASCAASGGEKGDLVSVAVDVLMALVQGDPNRIRSQMVEERLQQHAPSSGAPIAGHILCTIIDSLTSLQTAIRVRWQLNAICRFLLDTLGPIGGGGALMMTPNEDFLNLFYPDFASRLFKPLTDLKEAFREHHHKQMSCEWSAERVDVYFNVCELLCAFVVQHKYRLKYLLFKTFIVQNVATLFLGTSGRHGDGDAAPKVLRLCAVRLIRTMVGTGDDFYFRFMAKQTRSIWQPVLEEALALGGGGAPPSDCALSSAIVDLFVLIKEKKYHAVRDHLLSEYGSLIERVSIFPMHSEYSASAGINGALGHGAPAATGGAFEGRGRGGARGGADSPVEGGLSAGGERLAGVPDDLLPQRSRGTWSGLDESEEAYFSTEGGDGADDPLGSGDDEEPSGGGPLSPSDGGGDVSVVRKRTRY